MNVGIVVEYNPFHNGHLYQINEAKKRLSADIIIAVVSGDFVQRGEFSIWYCWVWYYYPYQTLVDLILFQLDLTTTFCWAWRISIRWENADAVYTE